MKRNSIVKTLRQYSALPVGTVLLRTKSKNAQYLFKVRPGLWFEPATHMVVAEQVISGKTAQVVLMPEEQVKEGA